MHIPDSGERVDLRRYLNTKVIEHVVLSPELSLIEDRHYGKDRYKPTLAEITWESWGRRNRHMQGIYNAFKRPF